VPAFVSTFATFLLCLYLCPLFVSVYYVFLYFVCFCILCVSVFCVFLYFVCFCILSVSVFCVFLYFVCFGILCVSVYILSVLCIVFCFPCVSVRDWIALLHAGIGDVDNKHKKVFQKTLDKISFIYENRGKCFRLSSALLDKSSLVTCW
jgi:hypothetical protein